MSQDQFYVVSFGPNGWERVSEIVDKAEAYRVVQQQWAAPNRRKARVIPYVRATAKAS